MGPVVPAMASLVQDVWLGWEPRLRARRLGPWEEPSARVIFHLDAGTTLNDPLLAGFLDLLASRLEVIACEPRGQGGSGGRLGPEVVADARRLMEESPRRWGDGRSVLLGGLGLGAWLALATADGAGVVGAFALAPSLAAAGPAGPEPGPLRAALEAALTRPPLAVPTLVVEERDAAETETAAVAEWRAREPLASRMQVAGAHVLAPPVAAAVAAWAEAVGRGARG